MELSETGAAATWAPEMCTLPASERPQRAAEFDALFAAAVRGIVRAGPGRLRLDLQPGPETAARAAELAAAETGCCSFFTFTITVTAGRLLMDITVPAAQAGTLDLLAGRAAAAAGIAAVGTGGTAA
jgi:hypothetical protein